jgi:hypothetical protein
MSELNQLVDKAGVFYAMLLLVLLVLLTTIGALFSSIRVVGKHIKSNHVLADSVRDNFSSLGDTLRLMMEANTEHFRQLTKMSMSSYLSTDLSIDLFRKMAEVHTFRKLKFIDKILKYNNLEQRKDQIKKNIEAEFRRITDMDIEQISRYKSVIGDIGAIVSDNIDWDELFNDTFNIVFSSSTNEQKLDDLEKTMGEYIIKIERKLRQYGDCNE